MTFNQFLSLVTKLCVLSKMELYRIMFNAFDLDGGGTISQDEFVEMVRVLNSSGASFDGNFQKALDLFDMYVALAVQWVAAPGALHCLLLTKSCELHIRNATHIRVTETTIRLSIFRNSLRCAFSTLRVV
jgi:hypothetical protein